MLFTGRDKLLDELHRQLNSTGKAAVLAPSKSRGDLVPRALQGLPGVGKTQVAVEYAHRYQREYQVVWWIPADQTGLIQASIAALAEYLDPASTAGGNVEDKARTVLDLLRRGQPFSRWLLIFDNAGQPEELSDYLLTAGPGHTIITSRNPAWRTVIKTLTVDIFTKAESRALLRKHLRTVDNADLDRLAEALGRLPLALEQAAALQASSGMTVREYLKLLDSQAATVLREGRPVDYPAPATAAITASFTKMGEENPNAVDLLRCCSFFGPEPFPRDVLSEGRDVVDAPLDALFKNPVPFNHAIGDLGRYSLANVDLGNRTLQVHRVIQAIVRDTLQSEEEREKFRHAVHLLLAAATPTDPDNPSSWPRYQELLSHYDPSGVMACHDRKVRLLVRGIVRYQYMIGNFGAALQWATRTLDVWTKDPESEAEDVLAVQRHLGDILRASGKYREAYQLNKKTIGEATARLGPDHDQTLRVTNSHGADLRAAGEFSEAYDLDAENVELSKRAFKAPDRRILRAQNNLAVDLVLLGRYEEAAGLHQEIYEAGRSVYGSDNHPSVLLSRINYACAVRLSGRYADACLMAEDTYAACAAALVTGHPVLLYAATDLAIALRKELGGGETRERATSLLGQHASFRGDNNPDTVAAIIAHANTLREAGDLVQATSLMESARATYKSVFDPPHPFALACTSNLAILRRLGGDPENARELHESALSGLTAALGSDHPFTLACATGLASDLSALGEIAAAVDLGEEQVARLRETLGAGHPVAGFGSINLAFDLQRLGRPREAEPMLAAALGAVTASLGPDHPYVAGAHAGRRLEIDIDPPPT